MFCVRVLVRVYVQRPYWEGCVGVFMYFHVGCRGLCKVPV